MGTDPKKEKVNKLYYLPLFICIPIVRKVFNDEAMQAMFDGYLRNSAKDVSRMLGDILLSGEQQGVKTVSLRGLQQDILD